MTIDVEDYFHVSAFADRVPQRDWEHFPSRVVANTHCLMKLLDRHQTRGTFFILGWVAERHPQLVKEIQRAGHEIGCHSYWHKLVYDLTPEEFRTDLVRGRDVLQEITGDAINLYRAPSFSITKQSTWAIDILADEGFTVDSSIYPIIHDRYGYPEADPAPHRILTPSGPIAEFPGNALGFCGLRLPISGGGYFRLYPATLTYKCLTRFAAKSRQPFMFYIHPWEVDPNQPRMPGSWKSRFRHYQNLATTESKLDWLLPKFRFGSMTDSLQSCEPLTHEYDLAAGLYQKARLSTDTLQPTGVN